MFTRNGLADFIFPIPSDFFEFCIHALLVVFVLFRKISFLNRYTKMWLYALNLHFPLHFIQIIFEARIDCTIGFGFNLCMPFYARVNIQLINRMTACAMCNLYDYLLLSFPTAIRNGLHSTFNDYFNYLVSIKFFQRLQSATSNSNFNSGAKFDLSCLLIRKSLPIAISIFHSFSNLLWEFHC